MLAIRDAHEQGATRVAVDGAHVLTGGQDGVVALFPVKRWPQAQPLWARQCHTAAVTFVALHDALHLAFSCGRDGHVYLHENIHDATPGASTSRLICRVTGEVRCMFFDSARRRLFLGGDSLRCLRMAGGRFEVHMVPLVVPFPIVTVAVSPCGALLAMASAQGSVGVVSVEDESTAANEETAPVATAPVRLVLDKVTLSASAGKDDQCTYRMQWCRTAGGLFLFVPCTSAAAVMRFVPPTNGEPARMQNAGMLYGEGLTDLFSVSAYATTSHRVCCVMAARTGGLYVGKVDDNKFRMARHASQRYDPTEHGALTDVQVSETTGDIVVGLSTGRASLLHRVALKAFDEAKEAEKKAKREEKNDTKLLGEETQVHSSGDSSADEDDDPNEKKKRAGKETADVGQSRAPNKKHHRREKEDDDFINDDATESDAEGASSSSSSSTSSNADSGSDSDLDEEGNVKVRENLKKVVVDLKANNADYIDDDDVDRPSRWRSDDPRRVLADAEREARRHKENASRFLDDEAEEASSTDVESEDAAAYEEDGYGVRQARRQTHRSRNEEEDGGADEEGEEEEGFHDEADADSLAHLIDGSGKSGAGSGALSAPAVMDYSFQVGATPAGEEESCYLAYNSTGFIRCTREGTTVHFHDISNPAVRIHEKGTIVMGTLSPVGAGFIIAPAAARGTDEPGTAALTMESIDDAEEEPRLVVYFRTFVALGAQSDWRARLQPGETVRCMAAGGRFLAVSTSRYLRLYSLTGLELAVLSKYPHIVAMAGTSSRKLLSGYKADFDPLAVVYLEGGTHKMEVLDVGTRSVGIPAQVLPLTETTDGSDHQLQWLGWSEDGPLHVADTAGVVRMFTQTWGGAWVPVFDPRALPDQSYNLWIWGVNDDCLLTYKSSKTDPPYPAAVASGLPVERVPLVMPLTRVAPTASGGAADRETLTWDHILRREIRTDELKRHSSFYSAAIARHDAVHDAKIKELFQNALRAQQTSRAMDLAMMLELRDNLEDCARDANVGGHTQLVQKLLTLYDMRVKSKLKRKCELPLEKAMVSEKERDELLRKLLVRERNGGKPSAPQATDATATSATTTGTHAGSAQVVEVDDEGGVHAPATQRARTEGSSPAKSEASTAVTATTNRSPHKSAPPASLSTASRRVTFNVPDDEPRAPNKTTTAATTTTATAAGATTGSGAAKPSNPFATKKGVAATAPAPPAPHPVTVPKEKTQTTLAPRPARTTFTTAVPSPSTASAPVDVIGVDSQQQTPSSLPESATLATPERATEQPTQDTPLAEETQEVAVTMGSHRTDSLSPSGGRATGTTPQSADKGNPGGAADTTVKPSTFVPKALAPKASSLSSSAAIDPFLGDDGDNGTSGRPFGVSSFSGHGVGGPTSDAEVVSVQQFIDVGHEDSLSAAPRSASFGEALRKRYRDDEEDGDSNDVVVPSTTFASA